MVALHAGLIVLPACEVAFLERRPPAALFAVAAGAFVLAQVLRYWAIRSAGIAWNARAVVAPSMRVSERGPYRYVRHPNYLAVLIEFSAVPFGGGAWISWIVLNALHAPVLAARIRGEERLLAGLPDWRARMAHKGRLLPRRTRV
jgi:methyltransferase